MTTSRLFFFQSLITFLLILNQIIRGNHALGKQLQKFTQ